MSEPTNHTERTRELARVTHANIGEVYNGILGLSVTFEYEPDGCCQGLGSYMLDASFVARFMGALGILQLHEAVGRSCWVTHTHDCIVSVEPLHKKDGRPFVISDWQEWVKRRCTQISWHELTTGENPNDNRPTRPLEHPMTSGETMSPVPDRSTLLALRLTLDCLEQIGKALAHAKATLDHDEGGAGFEVNHDARCPQYRITNKPCACGLKGVIEELNEALADVDYARAHINRIAEGK
jgi:hypothetical protein